MSNCFKRDVTKLQTIKLKIDRMQRKENPLGWALPQQSIKGQPMSDETVVLCEGEDADISDAVLRQMIQ
ncbi:hypothetical protein T05_15488 [Trichinella murrelli]|uniref:Uncharacterized protein n=1 Tax=Trichinella murrelli TaxID=144512 RepID=A0A0V0TCP7_9BILA|nr:hypothetical protein T05_15488 [Trichinella murrelli]